MLCCKRFKGKHSADRIRNEYEETISSFCLADKIIAVVSDNATNMIKAFSLPGYDDIKDTDESESEDENDDDNVMSDSDIFLPKHSRCYAHTLQLTVKDGLKGTGGLTAT